VLPRVARIQAALALAAFLLICGSISHAAEEFHALIVPDTTWANLYSLVEVHLDVDSTAHQFNGFGITFQYDPSVVSFDSLTPGDLMLDACPNWFNHLDTTDSTLSYTHIILCNLVSVDGPGRLCTIRFTADNAGISPVMITSDPDRSFYDAGMYVYPGHPDYPRQVIFHDGAIVVIDPNADCEEMIEDAGVRLTSIRPNPASSGAEILFELPEPAWVRLEIYDTMGRMVRTLIDDRQTLGMHSTAWNGTDDRGLSVCSGVYFCTMTAGDHQSRRRIVLLR